MTEEAPTLYEVKDGAAWITLNTPRNRNALSPGLTLGIYDHLAQAEADEAARCIVITGNGPAFCAGADLTGKGPKVPEGREPVAYPEVLTRILENKKPVIAAINGPARAGGLGLVCAADIAITVDDVNYSFTEVQIGVIPAIISVVCLRKLGTHHGMRLFLTGERFTAQQAVEYGMIHQAVPAEKLLEAVQAEIDMINLGAPYALAETKKLVRLVPQVSIEAGFQLTQDWSARMFQSEDGREGMASFAEKRKPRWQT
jgi:enoyl-CoA hydratase/carnithine racemase